MEEKRLHQEKNKLKKVFKKSVKNLEYEEIKKHLEYLKEYDLKMKTDKYTKYYNELKPEIKVIIDLLYERETTTDKIKKLENINVMVFEIFEERILKKIEKHINNYVDKGLYKAKKELIQTKKDFIQNKRQRRQPQ